MNKVFKLNDVAKYSTERVSLNNISEHNYISTDNLLQNKQGKVIAKKLPAQKGNLTKYDKRDILIANIRPYLKKIWFATNSGGSSADVLTIKVNLNFDAKFVYYSLFRDEFFEYVMQSAKGTRMPRGDKNQILNFPIPNFDYHAPKAIAKVLSDLDSKIELNNKINRELEAMAKTLYDYWFVQFDFPNEQCKPYKSSDGKMIYNEELKRKIPEGWELKIIEEWINNDKSGDWGKEIEQGNYTQKVSCIRGVDLNGLNGKGELNSPTRFILEKNSYKILENHDLIIEISGGSPTQSTGRLAFIIEETLERFEPPLICSNFCKAVTLKDEKYLFNFVYQWNRLYDYGVLFGWEGKTSGIKNLLFESFVTNQKEVYPKSDIVEKYYDFVKPMHAKKQKNLITYRFTRLALPMLMNGQVTV